MKLRATLAAAAIFGALALSGCRDSRIMDVTLGDKGVDESTTITETTTTETNTDSKNTEAAK